MKRSTSRLGGEDNSEIRAKILAGAEEVFARFGLRGATTAMIAERAGVSKPHIYYYFPSKEALYVALLERTLSLWQQAVPAVSPGMTPQSFLRSYVRAKLEFSRTNPTLSRIFASESLSGATLLRTHNKEKMGRTMSTISGLLEQWQAQGLIRPVNPQHFVFMLWAMTQHYADSARELELLLGKAALEETDFHVAERTILAMVFGALGLTDDDPAPTVAG